MAGLTSDHPGHDSSSSTIDQRLARISIVENHTPINRRDTAFIASVLHSLSHPFVDPSGVEEPRGEGFGVMGGCEAEGIDVEDELGPFSRSKGIPVNADDPGQSSTVWIEGTRGIMGFYLENKVVGVVELDYPRVVVEDR